MRLLLSAPLLLSFLGCEKQEYPITVEMDFLLPITITPSRRTLQLGDTLWLTANFADSLLDKTTSKRYRVQPQDLKLDSYIAYRELLGVGQEPKGIAPTFRIVEKVGRAWIDGATTGSLRFVYDGHNYHAQIGLIPTKIGITSLIVSLLPAGKTLGKSYFLPFINLPPDASGRERRASFNDGLYVINEGKANNFDLYSQYVKAFATVPGTPENAVIYETKSTFTVEVK